MSLCKCLKFYYALLWHECKADVLCGNFTSDTILKAYLPLPNMYIKVERHKKLNNSKIPKLLISNNNFTSAIQALLYLLWITLNYKKTEALGINHVIDDLSAVTDAIARCGAWNYFLYWSVTFLWHIFWSTRENSFVSCVIPINAHLLA